MIPQNRPAGRRAVLIHGVGNPAPGSIAAAVEQILRDAQVDAPAVEFNWNVLVDHPTGPEALHGWVAHRAARAIARTAVVGFHRRGSSRVVFGRWAAIQCGLIQGAHLCLVLAVLMVCTMGAALLAAEVSAALLGAPAQLSSDIMWGAARALVAASAMCAMSALAIATAIAVVERRLSALLVTARGLVLLGLQPLVAAAAVPFAIPWVHLRKDRVELVGAVMIVTLLVAGLLDWTILEEQRGVVVFACALAISVALLYFLTTTAASIAGGALKIVLDVAMYLGEPDYRERIQRGLAAEIAPLIDRGDEGEIVVVGHSLGSVVALDSLANSPSWDGSHHVRLVTLGSPLRRFFMRFWTGDLFPAGCAAAASHVAGRMATFRWLNVYRPFDQVGGNLALALSGSGQDHSTGQWSRILTAHPNYWSDKKVLDVVSGVWETLAPAPASKERVVYRVPTRRPRALLPVRRTLRLIRRRAALVAGGVLSLGAAWMLATLGRDILNRQHAITELMTYGTLTTGEVEWSMRVDQGLDVAVRSDSITVRYVDERTRRQRTFDLSDFNWKYQTDPYFDAEAVVEAAVARGCVEHAPRVWKLGGNCTRARLAVRVRHLPGQDVATLADFPSPSFSVVARIPAMLYNAFGATMALMMLGMLPLVVCVVVAYTLLDY